MTSRILTLFGIVASLFSDNPIPLPSPDSVIERPSSTVAPPLITLTATGDVMLGRSVWARTLKNGDPLYPFRFVQDILSSADITLVNLEHPLLDPCPVMTTGMTFCAPTSAVDSLVFAGIDVANLANNHTRNYGTKGYESTISTLTAHGILSTDASRLTTVEWSGMSFGFLGFDIISSWPDEPELLKQIQEADRRVDILVVSVHRGAEYAAEPSPRERTLLRSMVDAGADLIIGHHPHVVQPVELYKGVPIVYSLGNFVFDQMWSQGTREGIVGKFSFQGRKRISFNFIPIFIKEVGQPQEVTDPDQKQRIMKRLMLDATPSPNAVQDADDENSPEDDAR